MPFLINRVANSPDGWTQGQPYIKTPTGWKLVLQHYAKTGASTWTLRETLDTDAPSKPTLVGMTTNSTNRKVTITVKMPADPDVHHGTLKWWSGGHPLTEAGNNNLYPETGSPGRISAGPNQNVTWSFTAQRYDIKYYVSIWAVDPFGNASARLRLDFTVKSPVVAPPPKSPKPVKATYNPSSSGTVERAGTWAGNWSSWAGNLVIQAGEPNFAGGWFYGSRIKDLLKGKKKITKMTIRIQRVNSQHGVSAGANVYLVPYRLQTRGTAKTNRPVLTAAATPVLVGTLTRGQAKTFNVPSAWWPRFVSGDYQSLGLWTPSSSGTSWSHANYIQAYGRGTTSGQVYIEAT